MFELRCAGALLGRACLHDDLDPARVAQRRAARPDAVAVLPVGHHWATVSRLDMDSPAPGADELAKAALVHDIRIP